MSLSDAGCQAVPFVLGQFSWLSRLTNSCCSGTGFIFLALSMFVKTWRIMQVLPSVLPFRLFTKFDADLYVESLQVKINSG